MNEEAVEVISSTFYGVLATLNEDGSPYATPITYTFEDGQFSWRSASSAAHSKNIIRDGRISLCIVEPAKDARAVYVNSTARATGKTEFNEQWKQTVEIYELSLGELDTDKSTPGRFYFIGETS